MVGFGYDVHRLAEGETLVLGGVRIPSPTGTVAHSDGDALLHALCDALLGAAALGDIGEHFPDSDAAYKGVSSLGLLRRTAALVRQNGYCLINADCMVVLESPKISPHKDAMRSAIAEACGLPVERVSVKATTNERLGFVGSGEGVQAYAVCQIEPVRDA